MTLPDLSASIDPQKLDKLAEVAIKVGLQLQKGQDLVLTAPLSQPGVSATADAREFMAAARNGMTPGQWSNYSAFLARIDDAIGHQQQQVEQSRDRAQAGQREWLDTRTRVKAFETLSDRHQATLVKREAKAEQRVADDRSGRLLADD